MIRPLSINIAEAIPNAILTKTGANALGRACLNIVLELEEKPKDSEACTNSRDLILKQFSSCKSSNTCPS